MIAYFLGLLRLNESTIDKVNYIHIHIHFNFELALRIMIQCSLVFFVQLFQWFCKTNIAQQGL